MIWTTYSKYQVNWIYLPLFSLSLGNDLAEQDGVAAVRRDEGSHEIANIAPARQAWTIRKYEIKNKAFQEDDDKTGVQLSLVQNERSKAFVLKPFKAVELSNDESNIKVRLKL